MMPDISGIEVFGQVGDLKPQMRERFVFMTGGAFTPRAREFLASLEGEQLPKPFSLDQLRSLVAKRADSLPGDTPGQT
jgi:DNA-binding NtrC family response regulator